MKKGELDEQAITRWKYQRYLKDYLRSIRSMDEGIGEILAELDANGISRQHHCDLLLRPRLLPRVNMVGMTSAGC